ncbi:FtsH protease activity modulator HflK [Ectothiorhodospiraceae bacterium WFHF3C12]|nr:FtsH protease activity modulator HflK [Ectothiorhodospiraceae bacterium WFHF3C12]
MAWNEPGGGNRDPWSGPNNQGPPDLDEVIRKARERLSGLFGGKGPGGGGGGGTGGPGAFGIGILAAILVLVWLASGIYIIDEGWRGVVTRFGQHVDTTMPGPHWHLPYPIEAVEQVDVEERRSINIGFDFAGGTTTRYNPDEALMLTKDENIVSVQLTVQYEVGNPAAYVFNFVDPRQTLKEVTESALREVVGKRNINDVLSTDDLLTEQSGETSVESQQNNEAQAEQAVTASADIALATQELIEEIIGRYDLGLELSEVNIQRIQPPEPVQDAFLDAIKAREDRERLINEAYAYRNEVLPRARGESARIEQEAIGYKESIIADAVGDASRFTQLQTEYSRAPEVTRERLYLETMESVLGASGKVLIDVESGQPLMYLPLERMLRQSGTRLPDPGSGDSGSSQTSSSSSSSRNSGPFSSSDRLRVRGER